ncbi:uncharacterized protein K02A2.6-like [Venturia canescens]|uniref:uncharacterized protein K02A2.6-like n=1 Tax=Venturia canescens TaxID=32260 RepID=UPI001C9BE8FE|nr:uncharacterized protein K02A2.6-like [Venturia canescens]
MPTKEELDKRQQFLEAKHAEQESFKEKLIEQQKLLQNQQKERTTAIRSLKAERSNYDNNTDRPDDKIKDGFITGLKSGPVLDKVFEQSPTATLDEILEVARTKEASLAISSRSSASELHKIQSRSPKERTSKNISDNKKSTEERLTRHPASRSSNSRAKEADSESSCNHCGGVRHNYKTCKYKEYRCKICKKIGHLAKICRENVRSHNFIEVESEESFEISDMLNLEIDNSETTHELIELMVEDSKIKFEIDSGAGRSIIPEKIYKQFLNRCVLEKTSARLKMYDGTVLVPSGQINVRISNKKCKVQSQLIVVKEGCRPLLGRDLMKPLGFYIASINCISTESEVKEIIKQYTELFDGKLGKYKYEKIKIKLQQDVAPKFFKPRPVPLAMKKQLEEELKRLENEGVISLKSVNAWGTPLVPILKPDGKIRVCADYKLTVNQHIEDIRHPFPRIEEIFAALSGGEKFTKLDMSSAYNQLELTEDSKEILAWSTHRGVYAINRLPFGIKSACAIFQKTIEKILQGAKGVVSFLDDIIITGKNRDEHLQNLKETFERLSKAGLKLNKEKCVFFQSEVRYLGHILNKDGLKKNPEKVEAIINAPKPTNIKELQAFIGMVNYYAKFVPKFADIISPLYNILKNKEFKWSREGELAFNEIKKKMSGECFLTHFDPNLPIKLSCDASNVGIGAVLSHILPDGAEKPIAFASRVLRDSEKNYSAIHREALAIYWAANKFFQYLIGNEFLLYSDHKPLQALFGENKGLPQLAAGRLQRWALFLSGLNYKFAYVKGTENGGADGLSRLPLQVEKNVNNTDFDYFHFVVEDHVPVSADQIRRETNRDVVLSKVLLYTRNGWPESINDNELKPYAYRANECYIENGIVMWGYRAIIPKKLWPIFLAEIHSTHIGMAKMKMLARQYFWWPNLDKNIEEYVKNCNACMSTAKAPPKAALIKFREAEAPYERVHIDFLGPFHGKSYLLIIDAYSKWPEIFEMNKTDSNNTIEKLRECFARFGLRQIIFSDNGRQFTSDECAKFCELNGILHRTSAPYHPSTNGQAENAIGTFKRSITKTLNECDSRIKMTTIISRYLLTYRNIPHCTTGETPAKLLLGYNVRTRLGFLNKTISQKMREKQIRHFGGKREIEFKKGEIVYARCYKNPSKPTWRRAVVKEKLGERNYLCNTEEENVEWKRHVDQLKKSGTFYENELSEPSSEHRVSAQSRTDHRVLEECEEKTQNSGEMSGELIANGEPEGKNDQGSKDSLCEENQAQLNAPNVEISRNTLKNDTLISASNKDVKRDESLNVNSRPKRVVKPIKRLNL